MRAGQLRNPIVIEHLDDSQTDDLGATIKTWKTFAETFARIQPINGKEYFSIKQERGQVSHKIRIRFVEDVTPAMRVKLGSRIFDIQSVINFDERNREQELMVIENV